jgi:flavin reductase (DIM6/NTAB) family NADH-FMN oxidoreductase RutF
MNDDQVSLQSITDATEFRTAMGLFPTGVAIITSGLDEDTHVVTANSVTSISLDPPLLLVSIRADGKIRNTIDNSRAFSVSVLSSEQQALSVRFAHRERPGGLEALELLGGHIGQTGLALVSDALTSLECVLDAQFTGGDHVMFLGRVIAIHLGDGERRPLVTHRGKYVSILPPSVPEPS